MTNLIFGGRRFPIQKIFQRKKMPRDAEPALESVMLPKRLLQYIECPCWRISLDRNELGAIRASGQY